MILIFEGPDGAGKSTRLEETKEYLIDHPISEKAQYLLEEIVCIHHGPYETPQEAYIEFKANILNIEEDRKKGLRRAYLIDRCHISERIYSTVFREQRIADGPYHELDQALKALGACIILCLPPKEVCMANWAKRPEEEMFTDSVKYEEVYALYLKMQEIHDGTDIPVYLYDYTKEA